MKFFVSPLEISENEGFSEKDLFGRSHLANGMTNLVASSEDPLVMAFDGPWGSGKTTFLRMWAGELRNAGFPVVHFDAFANDYIEDAFTALTRELVAEAQRLDAGNDHRSKQFKHSAKALGVLLLKGGLRVGANTLLRSATAGVLDVEKFEDVAKDIQSEGSDLASKYIDQMFDNVEEEKLVVETFRETLSKIPTLLSSKVDGEAKPLVFIIDELDRCKPYFALAILERIKHFLSVPNVHFVLGVHLEQLKASVRFAYGSDIDAHDYLKKFINIIVVNSFPRKNYRDSSIEDYAKHLWMTLEIPRTRDVELTIDFITRFARLKNLSLRSIDRIFTLIATTFAFTHANYPRLGPILGGLIVLKLEKPELFRKAKQGRLELQDVMEYFQISETKTIKDPNEEHDRKFICQWWTWALADELPPELENFGQEMFRYNFHDRQDVITTIANQVVDSLQLPQ